MKTTLFLLPVFIAVSLTVHAQAWKLAGNILTGPEIMGSKNAFDVNFISNNKNRMSIKADGKIGFGTTNPMAKYNFYGLTRIDDSLGSSLLPLLILNGRSNNATIELRTNDSLKTIFGYDQSSKSFNVNVVDPYTSSIAVNRTNGDVKIGNLATPASKIDVIGNQFLNGDLTMMSSIGKGDINFTTDQQNIAFASPGPFSSAMIYMFGAPTVYKRMVFAHSLNYSNWGIEYDDNTDQFNFLGSGNNRLAVNLNNGRVGIGNATPSYTLDVTGNTRFAGNMGIQTLPNSRTLQVGSTQGALVGIGTAEFIQDAGSNTLSASASWVPVTDNLYSIGNASFRWKDVWAVDGTINTSDARDKENINTLDYGLREIMQLRSVRFNWKNNKTDGQKLGVIAQEIQKVLPEVVRDYTYTVDEATGKKTRLPSERLGVIYSDIIPVLIKGMQEQQQQIDALKQLVEQLTQSISATDNTNTANNMVVANETNLEQNTPNPFSSNTTIRYTVPVSVKKAVIVVTDSNGKTLKQMQLSGGGSGTVYLDGSVLAPGVYHYTLFTDGKIAGSKKMILTK